MIKQPVKLALSPFNEFQSKTEYLKARKEASKRGNRLIRHRYKEVLGKADYEEFQPLVISAVFG